LGCATIAFSKRYYSRDEMKKGEMGRTCGTFRRE